jgi:ribonuclease BN (tRNA processing enzyme)
MGVSGAAYAAYGGATTCVLAHFAGRAVILDAGSGLMNLPAELLDAPSLPLLLTHAHVDHLLGLPLCPYAMRRGARLEIYGRTRNGLDAEKQVRRFLAPPLWPVGPERLPAKIAFHDLPEDFHLGADGRPALENAGGVHVRTMEGAHPNGVSLLRLESGGKSVVLMTDCTLTERLWDAALEFARNCSLLLCDGQYSDAEWGVCSGFGHNTWTTAARFARECGARQARIIHHDPFHTDAMLDGAERELDSVCPGCAFAKEGELIVL